MESNKRLLNNTEYKEMEYKNDIGIEQLCKGTCFGYDFVILSLGTHPTAYVKVPKEHPYYKKHYNDIDISVHGWLTYSNNHLHTIPYDREDWWIGWDYAHAGDYFGLNSGLFNSEDKKWTTKEIFSDVESVCSQLYNARNKN